MTKCTGCSNCQQVAGWPYCDRIQDWVTLNSDGSCDYCPDNDQDTMPSGLKGVHQ